MEGNLVENRDYTLIIDKSDSMHINDQPGGKSRWEAAFESTLALAKKCEEIDPDGITVYLFSGRFRRYDNVTSEKVTQIYEENEPMGRSKLAEVLQDALENYFERKAAGEAKPNGETMLIITDGDPDDRKAVMRLIIEATQLIERDEELGISFIQVGKDKKATAYLKALDDQLQSAGAKFDIVDTVPMDKMENMSLTDVLLNALID
ncbi:MAG: VWA domain-containing protein [Gomphosphaeria aponina SAG 52.96 = DSM 107014]|uniref:VWA domain-containing protein n=1 Tax=Gomphosphaeria aponina SAG 52.96 = DSM 107014 TaxID=1521640 RepID=A0A941GSC1_9CHRO|nr:VWA domain-containing protein [Gomphosphaeria aponina SAG 52.96 = DSM 107014]